MTTARRRPGRPPIPRQRIIDVALTILDEEGADSLSLRAIATRLSSSTATLYRHVSGRSELIALVLDQLIGEARERAGDISALAWDEACHRVSATLFEVLAHHGRAAALLAEAIPVGENALAVRSALLEVLLRAGFPPEIAAMAVATLGRFVLGFAMQASPPTKDTDSPDKGRPSVGMMIDAERYPELAGTTQLAAPELSAQFAFGLERLLRGLRSDLPPKPRS